MENPHARTLHPNKKFTVHFEYCYNCHSHNWNTHHNQAKYHQTYIKLKNLIEESFKQNTPTITANKVPQYLLPIKEQQNKYYNSLTKKYVFFPNIGSFQITLNDEVIFSKKKTNTWPVFQTVLNDISVKIYQRPLQSIKPNPQKKMQTNQTQTQFSCEQKNVIEGYKTLYNNDQKNNPKSFGKFTLTDHFKSFHQQNTTKPNQGQYYFDSSTTIKQVHSNSLTKNINVQDIQGLRKALKKKSEDNERENLSKEKKNPNNEKEILINLCSIQEEGNSNIKEFKQFRVSNTFHKKPSAFINFHGQLEPIAGLNASEKSLSLKKFEELNNDLRNIEKRFQHIEKKMINSTGDDKNEVNQQYDQSIENSRCNNLMMVRQGAQNDGKPRNQSQSGFVKSKSNEFGCNDNAGQKENNFLSVHMDRLIKQSSNKPQSYYPNILQNSQIKVTDRYDQRYISPTYYEENELNKNSKSKKFSEIERYLKANNEEKNKKLKKIYGDWKVGTNSLNYLYYLEGAKRAYLRDSTNYGSGKSRQKMRGNMGSESNSNSSSVSSSEEKDQFGSNQVRVGISRNQSKSKNDLSNTKDKKQPSFIIKHKSAHSVACPNDSKQKLTKYRKSDLTNETSTKLSFYTTMKQPTNGNTELSPKVSNQKTSQKAKITPNNKLSSKSMQILHEKSKGSNSLMMVAKKPSESEIEHTKNVFKQVYRKNNNAPTRKTSSRMLRSRESNLGNEQIKKEDTELVNANLNVNNQTKQTVSGDIDRKNVLEKMNLEQEVKVQNKTEQCKITVEFHEFSLRVKSKKISKNQHLQNTLENQPEEKPLEERKENSLSIQNQVQIQLDLNQMKQSQIMKTKRLEENGSREERKESQQSQSNSQQDDEQRENLVPYLNLYPNHDQLLLMSSNINIHETQQNIKNQSSSSSSCVHNPAEPDAHKSHSRSSSLYEQPTYAHVMSHHKHDDLSPCKCEQRSELLQTNRMKVLSQRKQKQMMKSKRHEENKKRREQLEKEKEEYLKKLEQEITKKISEKDNNGSKIQAGSLSRKQSLEKQQSLKQHSLSKNERVHSNNIESSKRSPTRSLRSNKNDNNDKENANKTKRVQQKETSPKVTDKLMANPNTMTKASPNKAAKSITQAQKSKQSQQKQVQKQNKKPRSVIEKTSEKKQQSIASKTSLPHKTSQRKLSSHNEHEQEQFQGINPLKKQSKSISSQLHTKPQKQLTKKSISPKNKSYFKIEKQTKIKSNSVNVIKKDQIQDRDQQDYVQSDDEIESQKGKASQSENKKLASIAIQTMGFEELRKYSLHEEGEQNSFQQKMKDENQLSKRSQRNQSIQSRTSSLSRRSALNQSIKSQKRNQIVQQTYSPINVKGSKRKGKNSITKRNSSKANSLQSESQMNDQNEQSKSKQTIVNIFQTEDQQQQEGKIVLNQNHFSEGVQASQYANNSTSANQSLLYCQQRQRAILLKQIYNMDKHIAQEINKYEILCKQNKLYSIGKNSLTSKSDECILQSILEDQQCFHHDGITKKNIKLASVDELVLKRESNSKEGLKIKLFGSDSVQIHKLKSNSPYLTRNFHQVLAILCEKNELLIVRLFEDYRSETSFVYQKDSSKPLLHKSYYGVWLSINKVWRLVVVDNIVPVQSVENDQISPLFSYHEGINLIIKGNQIWPYILEKCLAKIVGGYEKLFSLSVGQLFSLLTGSNHVSYPINQNISKNKYFLKEISENDKKNFIMVCEKYPSNLKEENEKMIQDPKTFYLISKKMVHNGNSYFYSGDNKQQMLFKMKQSMIDGSTTANNEPYYIRYDTFCEKFKTCEALHLRQHNNFCSLFLNQTLFSSSNSNKNEQQNYFNVVQLVFDEQSFGTITISHQQKGDIRTYLYKLQQSDNQIMKLVGQANKLNKKELFFDCFFQEQKYYLFIQSSNPNSVVSYMGEGRPEIKVKQQISSNGLRNQSIEYLPVSKYEGLEGQKSVMGRTFESQLYSSHMSATKKPRNMDDLRDMFVGLLLEERNRK